MKRLLSAFGMFVLYVCFGALLGQGAVVGYLWSTGFLSPDKLREIDAVMRDFTPADVKAAAKAKAEAPTPTLADVARARALAQRDMELREQSLRQRADQLQLEQTKLIEQQAQYAAQRKQFEQELAQMREATSSEHVENARQTIESMKPRQAKEQLLRMVDSGDVDEAVAMLSAMPLARRAKLVGEFKTEDESRQLADLLRRIREGEPELKQIDAAAAKVGPGTGPAPTLGANP